MIHNNNSLKKIFIFIICFVSSQVFAQNTWVQKASLQSGRNSGVGFSIGTKGYIGLGNNYIDFWEYDPNTNTWTQKANFAGNARSGAVGFSIGNKGYVGTGSNLNDLGI